jgi:hypothetical protein
MIFDDGVRPPLNMYEDGAAFDCPFLCIINNLHAKSISMKK